jgi:hypothetical protein
MDVAAWLQGLGLERYAPAFRNNAAAACAKADRTHRKRARVLGYPKRNSISLVGSYSALHKHID